MPKFAEIESGPHYLKLLQDYAKTAVALSSTLLALSVTFAEKLVKSPPNGLQSTLLILLWLSLAIALIASLRILSSLTGTVSNSARARQFAYPDAIETIRDGGKVKIEDASEEVQVTDQSALQEIRIAIDQSLKRRQQALYAANLSFYCFGFAALFIVLIGFDGLRDQRSGADAVKAVETSLEYVIDEFKVKRGDAQLYSLNHDQAKKTYEVLILNASAPKQKYEITIDKASGDVIMSKMIP